MMRIVAPALIVVLALAGCASVDTAEPRATPSSVATASPTATPTEAPPVETVAPETAPPEAAVPVAGCDTVLTAAEYVDLENDGLALTPDPRAFDDVMQTIMDAGFGCEWKRAGGDVRVWFAQANQSGDSWAAQRQQLVDANWALIDTAVGGALQAPADHDPSYSPAVMHSDGVTYYASYPDFFSSVTALAG